jgi:hypothetical protein
MEEQEEKRFSVRFPLDVLATVKKIAKEDGRSINSEIIWILKDYLTKRESKKK